MRGDIRGSRNRDGEENLADGEGEARFGNTAEEEGAPGAARPESEEKHGEEGPGNASLKCTGQDGHRSNWVGWEL